MTIDPEYYTTRELRCINDILLYLRYDIIKPKTTVNNIKLAIMLLLKRTNASLEKRKGF